MPPAKCETWIFKAGKFVEKSAVDEPHCRHHQREFPAEHTAEIVRVHVCPADDPWQRVDENVEAEVGGGLPKWAQSIARRVPAPGARKR